MGFVWYTRERRHIPYAEVRGENVVVIVIKSP